ncbi:Curculin-1 [Apostasia shenzhenica]|uniref:Curculin-1 n=1 Tax=Apostasia shenzhenica TaxID=1088818 RepID=A0A2H9ZZ54_9ASPA|nr:Curculin-1 [Apostasia shenzhenica]
MKRIAGIGSSASFLLVAAAAAAAACLLLATGGMAAAGDNYLLAGETLHVRQSLTKSGNYSLDMQADCNLVLYDNGVAVSSTGTTSKGINCELRMQPDGNLVIYDGSGKVVWATGTNFGAGEGQYVLLLQGNGTLVLYNRTLWNSTALVHA